MGIALSDILKAQGELVLSVTSLLTYAGYFEVEVMYKTLFYYSINCSKLCNLVLILTLTLNVVNAFGRINEEILKKVVRFLCLVITLLHIFDAYTVIIILSVDMNLNHVARSYLYTIMEFDIPVIFLVAAALCHKDNTGNSNCTEQHLRSPLPDNTPYCVYLYDGTD